MKVTLLDTELLRSMRHLGWGDLQHLLRSLRSDLYATLILYHFESKTQIMFFKSNGRETGLSFVEAKESHQV
jgi:hypothetical protein